MDEALSPVCCSDCRFAVADKDSKGTAQQWAFARCGHEKARELSVIAVGQVERKGVHQYFCSTERSRWGSCGVQGRNFVRK